MPVNSTSYIFYPHIPLIFHDNSSPSTTDTSSTQTKPNQKHSFPNYNNKTWQKHHRNIKIYKQYDYSTPGRRNRSKSKQAHKRDRSASFTGTRLRKRFPLSSWLSMWELDSTFKEALTANCTYISCSQIVRICLVPKLFMRSDYLICALYSPTFSSIILSSSNCLFF